MSQIYEQAKKWKPNSKTNKQTKSSALTSNPKVLPVQVTAEYQFIILK